MQRIIINIVSTFRVFLLTKVLKFKLFHLSTTCLALNMNCVALSRLGTAFDRQENQTVSVTVCS